MAGNAPEKIVYGLKNVHYAILTYGSEDSQPTYSAPKKYPGSVNLALAADGETVEFYADDMVYYSTNTNNGYTGDFESAAVPDTFKVEVLGDVIIDELQYELSDADPKHIALMAEFDTDVIAKRICLYDVLCKRPDVSSKTKEKTPAPVTSKMSITARPITINGRSIVKCSTTAATSEEKYNSFFDAVPLPAAAQTTAQTEQQAGGTV